ncbi:MAG: aquaporin, partial [bacterium]
LTTKEYILINLSKIIVEIAGTATIGLFYNLLGGNFAGQLFGYWIMTLFAFNISGAHFNPAVTVACMLRKNSNFGERRIKGFMYIAG